MVTSRSSRGVLVVTKSPRAKSYKADMADTSHQGIPQTGLRLGKLPQTYPHRLRAALQA